MLKQLQKSRELELTIKKFAAKNKNVFDIALYGSFARGKKEARDIDFAVLLSQNCEEKTKLELSQNLKESIEKILPNITIDIKTIDMLEFFDQNFLARQGIIAEGYLILRKTQLSKILGFKSFALIKYSLKGLSQSHKKMLYYALKGRRNIKGILKEINGESISREIIKIPIESSHQIEKLLVFHKVKFTEEFMMSYKKRLM